ncbi:MAG: Gx transporter family protein [Tissierellia bacterium]|nr:Gx transporter family protein [Tissierellia bacterium]
MNKIKMLQFTTMALMITIAMVLSYFERFIPLINVPGVKLGLANIVTLLALYLFDFKQTLIIVVLRVLLVSMFTGSPISLIYSMSGGLVSLIGMKLLLLTSTKVFSLIGISIIGAFLHNTAQAIVLGLLINSFSIARVYYPILIVAAVVTGFLTGLIGRQFMKQIEYTPLKGKRRYPI